MIPGQSFVRLGAAGVALALACACTPKDRNFGNSGGAGGEGGATSAGPATTGAGGATATTSSTTGAGGCTDTLNDPHNCGKCGNDCFAAPNVTSAACAQGTCVIVSCAPAYDHCGMNPALGCDTKILGDDPANCGKCGGACGLALHCAAGLCAPNFPDCAMVSCSDPMCQEPMRYAVTKDIVVDLKNSGRLWERDFGVSLNFQDSHTYCAALSLAGITGWRVPESPELGTILLKPGGLMGCPTPQYCSPAIDQAAFPATQSDLYWSNEPYMVGIHYCFSFCDGRKTPYKEDDTELHAVRCVHDALPP